MTPKDIEKLTPAQLQELEIESQRAWEDKRRSKREEAILAYQEAKADTEWSREGIEEGRGR
tara:strand:- start:1996 stop:2178 length:183 start_codon:yes stop_codon:yes gene_type:complete